MRVTYRMLLSGVVQGVGFRYFVYRRAKNHGIEGYVRNLSDGRVEIVASAAKERLDEFLEEVRKGPLLARVEEVEVHPADDSGISGFIIE